MNIKQIAKIISEDIDVIHEQGANGQLEGIKSEVKRVVQKLISIFDQNNLPRQQAMQLLTTLIQEVAAAGQLSKTAVQQVYQNYQKAAPKQQASTNTHTGQMAKYQQASAPTQSGLNR